ncbi:MAG: hypothetical protein AAGI17_08010 [Planctomycetota bacterium]
MRTLRVDRTLDLMVDRGPADSCIVEDIQRIPRATPDPPRVQRPTKDAPKRDAKDKNPGKRRRGRDVVDLGHADDASQSESRPAAIERDEDGTAHLDLSA